MVREIRSALVVFAVLTVVTGVLYPGVTTLIGALAFGEPGERQRDRGGRPRGRVAADRTAVLGRAVLLEPAVGDRPDAVQRRGLERLESGPDQSRARGGGARPRRRVASRGPGQYAAGARGSRDGVRQRARSAHLPGRGGIPGRARRARARHRSRGAARRSCAARRRDARSACSASRESTCSSSTSRSIDPQTTVVARH